LFILTEINFERKDSLASIASPSEPSTGACAYREQQVVARVPEDEGRMEREREREESLKGKVGDGWHCVVRKREKDRIL